MIYLASNSPRRRELLDSIGVEYKIMTNDADENINDRKNPAAIVKEIAKRKADAAMLNVSLTDNDYLISADTIVYADGRIIGKPTDNQNAFEILSVLSGKYHTVYTGYCVYSNSKKVIAYDKTRVKFKILSDIEIINYIESGEASDKAGAYGIAGRGCLFIEKITGDYNNVMGLPLFKIMQHIRL